MVRNKKKWSPERREQARLRMKALMNRNRPTLVSEGNSPEHSELVQHVRTLAHYLIDVQLGLVQLSDEDRAALDELHRAIGDKLRAAGENVREVHRAS